MATVHKITLCVALLCALNSRFALSLSLQQAEAIALQHDPAIAVFIADAQSYEQLAQASDELPDPQLRVGLFNLPIDSFELDAEPSTQLRLGLQQSFPRGDRLEIMSARQQLRSTGSLHRADQARLALLRDLRITYLELYYQTEAATIIVNSRRLFDQLVNITEDRYAAGRANQQDVISATLQLTRLDDRYTRILAMQDSYRAKLASWIGDSAAQPLNTSFPELPELQSSADMISLLATHPQILAVQADMQAEKKLQDIARQDYSPGMHAFVEYRKRFGNNPDGSERSDMMAAMVTLDIPLFSHQRLDSELAASSKKVDAARYRLDDSLRQLKQQLDTQLASYQRAQQRQKIFEERLLAAAVDNANAALTAYQSGVTDFTALMRARVTELDVLLDALRVRIDKSIAHTHLLYLEGGL